MYIKIKMFLFCKKEYIKFYYIKFLHFFKNIINNQMNLMRNKKVCSNVGRYSRLQAPIVRAHRGESIKAETVQREEKTDTESAPSTARMLWRGSSRGASAAFRIDWTAGRLAGRSVGRGRWLERSPIRQSITPGILREHGNRFLESGSRFYIRL